MLFFKIIRLVNFESLFGVNFVGVLLFFILWNLEEKISDYCLVYKMLGGLFCFGSIMDGGVVELVVEGWGEIVRKILRSFKR